MTVLAVVGAVGLVVGVAAVGYLLFALIRPESF